jgi:protein phosphatase
MSDLVGETAIQNGILATHLALHHAMREHPRLSGMGTTVAGLRLTAKEAICFNVGDSRIYVSDGALLRQISEDQVVGGNLLTQCLGGGRQFPPIASVSRVPLKARTRLLLCSDGLSDMVGDDQISAHLWSPDPATSLVGAALAAGGVDNVTAVVVETT